MIDVGTPTKTTENSSPQEPPPLALDNGSRVAVIGGGPAGSLFSYFLLEMAGRVGIEVEVDVYEPRDFSAIGPPGCNMCGGIISESLMQMMAADGILLPDTVIQRGIDSYVLHTDTGVVRVETPLREMRIGSVHRGAGPRGATDIWWASFDRHLLELARQCGARTIRGRVDELEWTNDGRPRVSVKGCPPQTYDLVVGAAGVNTSALKLFEGLGFGYRPPKVTRAFISEFLLGHEQVTRYLGSAMHVFLVDLPRLEFAALIPKGEYVSLAMLGCDIDQQLVDDFLSLPQVRACFPPEWERPVMACHCSPHIYEEAAVQPFADRVVLIGDCSVSRLYKNGIGAAYRTAKAAAITAIFDGVSEQDFRRHYWPVCRAIDRDNRFGRVVFQLVGLMRRLPFSCRAMLRMAQQEQLKAGQQRRMSMVLWDTFTGSAAYSDIFLRTLRPAFILHLTAELIRALLLPARRAARQEVPTCTSGS